MENTILIRKYNSEDKSKLINVLELNIPKYFSRSEIKDFEDYLNNEIQQYFVVEFNGEVIGSGGINIENNSKTGKISWDFINPNFQGLGVGKKLLDYRIEILKSMKDIEIISVRTSQLAYKFYQKSGFVLKEIQKDFWAEGLDMYIMIYE